MPKLPSVSARTLIAFLKFHGFREDHTTGSHVVFYDPASKRRAVVPYHRKDMPKGTLLAILREAGFRREDFFTFLNTFH